MKLVSKLSSLVWFGRCFLQTGKSWHHGGFSRVNGGSAVIFCLGDSWMCFRSVGFSSYGSSTRWGREKLTKPIESHEKSMYIVIYTYMDVVFFLWVFMSGKVNGFHTQPVPMDILLGDPSWCFFFCLQTTGPWPRVPRPAEVQLSGPFGSPFGWLGACFQRVGCYLPGKWIHIPPKGKVRKIIDSNMPFLRGICLIPWKVNVWWVRSFKRGGMASHHGIFQIEFG